MGITGLIPFLEKASSKTNIKDFKGYTVAIDTYCWLHKGAFGCADKLSRGEDTDIYVQYCLKYVNLLLSHNIKPILVFDGRHLPAKALTEQRRRESRKQSKKRAAELFRLGKTEEARSHIKRCIDITHEMALRLIQQCRNRNIDCIVAPYEADAQLAYLNKLNIAQYVITEDSDLVLFGCKKIIFKLDLMGNCLLVDANNLHLAMGCREDKFTFDKFRCMCILSGCDYLDSLPGVGLVKACKFILKTEETDMTKALKKIPQYLNIKNLVVTDDYIDSFLRAEATFKHMFVYDPFQRCMVRLNELPINNDDYEKLCSNAGKILENDIAFDLALGNLDPFTLKKLDNWNPDNIQLYENIKTNSWNQATRTKHKSIWQASFTVHVPKEKEAFNAISFTKVKYKFNDRREDTAEDAANNFQSETSIISMYCNPDADDEQQPSSKRKCVEKTDNKCEEESCIVTDDYLKNNTNNEQHKMHNPFAKNCTENLQASQITRVNNTSFFNNLSPVKKPENNINEKQLAKLSKFKRTVILDEKKEIKSRFFLSNTLLMTKPCENKNDSLEEYANEEFGKEVAEIENQCDEMMQKNTSFYTPKKDSTPGKKSSPRKDLSPRKDSSPIKNDEEIFETKRYEDECNIFETPESEPSTSQKENDNFSMLDDKQNKAGLSDVIEISDTEQNYKKSTSPKMIKRRGLSNKKSKITNKSSDSQTRLSMFGFKKKIL